MSIAAIFVADVGITLLASLLVVRYLMPSLRKILTDICGTEDRARFWAAFSNVTLVLVPTIFALHYHPRAAQDTLPVFEMSTQIEWALIGLAVSVVIMGFIISLFIPRQPGTVRG